MQIIIEAIIIFIILFLIVCSLYLFRKKITKEFDQNTFVLKLRNGNLINTSQGGTITCLPLIDELITIPISEQEINFDVFNKGGSQDKNFELKGSLIWKVSDPLLAYSNLNWNQNDSNYSGNIIKNVVESKLQTRCADKTIDDISLNESLFIFEILNEIRNFFENYSISIKDFVISDIIPIAVH